MIVRVLGDRQYEVSEELASELEQFERRLDEAVSTEDEAEYGSVLDELIAAVRRGGRPLDAEALRPSDLTVPHEGSTIAELKSLLESEAEANPVSEGA